MMENAALPRSILDHDFECRWFVPTLVETETHIGDR